MNPNQLLDEFLLEETEGVNTEGATVPDFDENAKLENFDAENYVPEADDEEAERKSNELEDEGEEQENLFEKISFEENGKVAGLALGSFINEGAHAVYSNLKSKIFTNDQKIRLVFIEDEDPEKLSPEDMALYARYIKWKESKERAALKPNDQEDLNSFLGYLMKKYNVKMGEEAVHIANMGRIVASRIIDFKQVV